MTRRKPVLVSNNPEPEDTEQIDDVTNADIEAEHLDPDEDENNVVDLPERTFAQAMNEVMDEFGIAR
jgi:hypothetical protein